MSLQGRRLSGGKDGSPHRKGFLNVKAYTTTASGSDITLHQLHAMTHTLHPVQEVRPRGRAVSSEEIVKGYECAKGQYVIVEEDEIEKLGTESDKSIRIDGFIKPDQLSSVYLGGRTYYLTPDGPGGQKPYNLLMQERALRDCRSGHLPEGTGRARAAGRRRHGDDGS
jgi:DNA end-binding protein Ku